MKLVDSPQERTATRIENVVIDLVDRDGTPQGREIEAVTIAIELRNVAPRSVVQSPMDLHDPCI